MKGQPIVGENDDEEDQVDAEMQHVRQELQVEHIDSLQDEMKAVRVA